MNCRKCVREMRAWFGDGDSEHHGRTESLLFFSLCYGINKWYTCKCAQPMVVIVGGDLCISSQKKTKQQRQHQRRPQQQQQQRHRQPAIISRIQQQVNSRTNAHSVLYCKVKPTKRMKIKIKIKSNIMQPYIYSTHGINMCVLCVRSKWGEQRASKQEK